MQGELARVVRDITGQKKFEIYGSGRTDAGVHALAQVAHLDVSTASRQTRSGAASTTRCPATSISSSIELARGRFHARHDAVARSYLYQISRRRSAFAKNFVWWVREDLDLERMRRAAEPLVGHAGLPVLHRRQTPRTSPRWSPFERIEIAEDGDLILVRVEGSHFLWKMVRRMVGVHGARWDAEAPLPKTPSGFCRGFGCSRHAHRSRVRPVSGTGLLSGRAATTAAPRAARRRITAAGETTVT